MIRVPMESGKCETYCTVYFSEAELEKLTYYLAGNQEMASVKNRLQQAGENIFRW